MRKMPKDSPPSGALYSSTSPILQKFGVSFEKPPLATKRLRWLFIEHRPQARDEERRFLIVAGSEARGQSVISVEEFPDLGIALRLTLDVRGVGHEAWISVGDRTQLEDVFDAGDDEFASRGMFLPVEKAWLAVEDFMTDPFEKSSRIEWEDEERYPGLPDWML